MTNLATSSPSENSADLAVVATEEHSVASLNDTHIVLIAGSAGERRNLRTQLELLGANVKEFESGSSALEYLIPEEGQNIPEIIIVSKELSDMDGLVLAQYIRANPALSRSKLISMGSALLAALQEQDRPNLFAAHLQEPGNADTIRRTLETVLECSSSKSENTPRETAVADTTLPNKSAESRILLVEDNPMNQTVAKEMLSRLGYSVDIAESGLKAIEHFQTGSFDLILMDCQMPEMDGYETTRMIRRWEEENQCPAIPIVALTANALRGDREKCLEAGMNDYTTKPFTMKGLEQILIANLSGASG